MDPRVRVFPVRSIARPTTVTTRDGRSRPCTSQGVWYADWHDARRGEGRHHAQDIFAPLGSEVLAPNDGVIVASSRDSGPSERGGHFVKLAVRHHGRTHRTYTLTHLLDAPRVGQGDRVSAGQVLGRVGNTGNASSTCPHLHLSAHRYAGGVAINLFSELRAVDPYARRSRGRTMSEAQAQPRTQPSSSEVDRDHVERVYRENGTAIHAFITSGIRPLIQQLDRIGSLELARTVSRAIDELKKNYRMARSLWQDAETYSEARHRAEQRVAAAEMMRQVAADLFVLSQQIRSASEVAPFIGWINETFMPLASRLRVTSERGHGLLAALGTATERVATTATNAATGAGLGFALGLGALALVALMSRR